MFTSRKNIVIFILFHCVSAAPQYFEDRGFNPYTENVMNEGETGIGDDGYNPRPTNYQGNDFLSDKWFDVNALPTQESSDNFWPEVSESLTPPIHAESQFDSVVIEPENQHLNIAEFERGRADIDPDEDSEEFQGYYYPKPKIPFDLPDFQPVSAASDAGAENATVITTTANSRDLPTTLTAETTTTSSNKA